MTNDVVLNWGAPGEAGHKAKDHQHDGVGGVPTNLAARGIQATLECGHKVTYYLVQAPRALGEQRECLTCDRDEYHMRPLRRVVGLLEAEISETVEARVAG